MKGLIFIISLFFTCDPIIAQNRSFKKMMPGIDLGINIAQQQLRRSDQVATMRSGLRAGLSLESPATRRLTFLSTLSFVQSGAKNVRFSSDDERINYAEFSIKAVKYSPAGGSDLFLSLGPYFSYGINGKVTNSIGETVVDDVFDLSEYQRFEWGFGGNIGFKTPWGTYLQTGLQGAFNNFYEVQESKYFNFSLMVTAGHTIGWRTFKSFIKTP